MVDLPAELTESTIDFETAVAYALQPVMRRLIILYIVGLLLVPVGLDLFLNVPPFRSVVVSVIEQVIGLVLIVIGATLLFGGLVGAAFKLVTDANRLAAQS